MLTCTAYPGKSAVTLGAGDYLRRIVKILNTTDG